MLDKTKRTFYKIREEFANGSFMDFIRTQIFVNKVATPVEMDLTIPATAIPNPNETDYEFFELKLNDIIASKWSYPTSSRLYKTKQFLKKGWRGFAIAIDSTVIGDVWCVPYTQGMAQQVHPDLKMLGIRCGEGEAYAFDMLIDPSYRGKNLAGPLHKYLHSSLRKDGFQKVYGYYWNDNLPALWMHRMIKFHELPKRRVSRFFFIIRARPFDQGSDLTTPAIMKSERNPTKDKS